MSASSRCASHGPCLRRDSGGNQSSTLASAARSGMHRQAGGLVQHHEAVIAEQDRRHHGSLPEFVRDGKAVAGCAPMRIHIQNPVDDPLFLFSRAMWDAACARAPDVGAGHEVTIGDSDADFADGVAEAEALITEIGVVAAKFPCRCAAAEAAVHHQRRTGPAGAVRLAAAGRGAAEQRRRARGEGRRVRHHVGADAGQPRAGDGDASARRTLAEAVGRRAGRAPRHRGGAWLAGWCRGNAGDAVRHARHRRARDGDAASALRRGDHHCRASIGCCRGRSSWCSPARSPRRRAA